MNIALTGDWQLSEQSRFSRRLESGITSRLQDQATCIEWLAKEAVKRGCTHLAVLGDIFDQRNAVTAPVLDQAGRIFRRLKDRFEKVYVLVGNHDAPLRTPALTSLRVLDGLVTVIDAPTVTEHGIAFVPWMDDPDDYRAAIGSVSSRKSGKKQRMGYLCSHMMVQGAVPAGKGLPVAALRPQLWRKVFLGDVHEPVELPPNIQYVGAQMQHHYGDAGGERGFWVLDTYSGKTEYVENTVSPRFHIVTSTRDLKGVRSIDFVRVQSTEAEVEAAIVAEATKRSAWVEARPIELDEVPVRLEVSSSHGIRETLERYVSYQFSGEPVHEALVDTGMRILDEVL